MESIKEATSEDDRNLATAFTQLPTRQKFPAYYATIMHPIWRERERERERERMSYSKSSKRERMSYSKSSKRQRE